MSQTARDTRHDQRGTPPLYDRALAAYEETRAEHDAAWAQESAKIAEHHHAAARRELERITETTISPQLVTVAPGTFTASAHVDGLDLYAPHSPNHTARWHLGMICPTCQMGTYTEASAVSLANLGSMLAAPPPWRAAPHTTPNGDPCGPETAGKSDSARPGDPEPRHIFHFAAGTRELREHYDRIARKCRTVEFRQMGTGIVLIGELWPIPTSEGERF